MINQRLQNAINKIIDKKFDEFRNYNDIVEYIKELLDLETRSFRGGFCLFNE